MFLTAAALVALVAAVVWGRFFVLFIQGDGAGHVQSVVLGAMLFVVAVQLAALGIIGDLLAANRVLIQRTLERTRRIELKLGVEPSHYEPGERRGPARPHAERDDRPLERPRTSPPTEEHETVPLGGPPVSKAGAPAAPAAVPTGNTYDKYGSTNPVVQAADGAVRARHVRAARPCGAGVDPRRRLRRGRADRAVGGPHRRAAWSGIDLEDPKLRSEWERRGAPEPRVPRR